MDKQKFGILDVQAEINIPPHKGLIKVKGEVVAVGREFVMTIKLDHENIVLKDVPLNRFANSLDRNPHPGALVTAILRSDNQLENLKWGDVNNVITCEVNIKKYRLNDIVVEEKFDLT
jgi:hypothetical protein